jgi:hypothetical protein
MDVDVRFRVTNSGEFRITCTRLGLDWVLESQVSLAFAREIVKTHDEIFEREKALREKK